MYAQNSGMDHIAPFPGFTNISKQVRKIEEGSEDIIIPPLPYYDIVYVHVCMLVLRNSPLRD